MVSFRALFVRKVLVVTHFVGCVKYKMWVHKKCSGVKGRLKVDSNFQCKKCSVNGTTTVGAVSAKNKNLLLENSESIECVEEFCYLGDMLNCGGGAGAASRVRVGCAWKKFRKLMPVFSVIL